MTFRIALAAAATLALAACGSSGKPAAPASEAPKMARAAPAASAAAPAASPAAAGPAATPAKGSPPTKEFMVGKWADAGGCELAIDFKADGTTEGPFGNWTLTPDGILSMADAPQKVHMAVVDGKTMDSWMDGNPEHKKMMRCP